MDDPSTQLQEATTDVEPAPDLFERLERGHRKRQRRRRFAIGVVALAVASAGLVGPFLITRSERTAPSRPGPTPSNKTGIEPISYTLALPDAAIATSTKGVYELQIATNLPDGTVAMVDWEGENGGGGGTTTISTVDGIWTYMFLNNQCALKNGQLVSLSETLRIDVSPNYDMWTDGPADSVISRQWQPPAVLDAVGPNFERLSGPNVVHDFGGLGFNVLELSHEHQLSNETCIPNGPWPTP